MQSGGRKQGEWEEIPASVELDSRFVQEWYVDDHNEKKPAKTLAEKKSDIHVFCMMRANSWRERGFHSCHFVFPPHAALLSSPLLTLGPYCVRLKVLQFSSIFFVITSQVLSSPFFV